MLSSGFISTVFLIGLCYGATRELWNTQVDITLNLFDTAASEKATNLEYIPIHDLVANNVTLSGLKLGMMWSLKRDSDIFLETEKENMTLIGNFTLQDFKLLAKEFKYKTHSGPANITSGRNNLEVSYTISKKNDPQCRTEWNRFQLHPFKSLIIHTSNPVYNQTDITEDINKFFIPKINNFFNSTFYKNYLGKDWDFCFSKFFM